MDPSTSPSPEAGKESSKPVAVSGEKRKSEALAEGDPEYDFAEWQKQQHGYASYPPEVPYPYQAHPNAFQAPQGGAMTSPSQLDTRNAQQAVTPANETPTRTSKGSYTVKWKLPTREDILARRQRKNEKSRARAAKLKERLASIQSKPESERTEEEIELLAENEERRKKKNERSKERVIEKKADVDRILAKPESKRTKNEKNFLKTFFEARDRKNLGNRLRRNKVKAEKTSSPANDASPQSHPPSAASMYGPDPNAPKASGSALVSETEETPRRPQLKTPGDYTYGQGEEFGPRATTEYSPVADGRPQPYPPGAPWQYPAMQYPYYPPYPYAPGYPPPNYPANAMPHLPPWARFSGDEGDGRRSYDSEFAPPGAHGETKRPEKETIEAKPQEEGNQEDSELQDKETQSTQQKDEIQLVFRRETKQTEGVVDNENDVEDSAKKPPPSETAVKNDEEDSGERPPPSDTDEPPMEEPKDVDTEASKKNADALYSETDDTLQQPRREAPDFDRSRNAYPPAGPWPYPPPMHYGTYPPYPPPYPNPYHPPYGMPPPYPPHDRMNRPALSDVPGGRAATSPWAASYGIPVSRESPDNRNYFDENANGKKASFSVRAKVPTRADALARREKKNARSRARDAKKKERIEMIKNKAESERTEEEKALFADFEARRKKKNDRSKERAEERKAEVERILAKPEKKRTKVEKDFLETFFKTRDRKNANDRKLRLVKRARKMGQTATGSESTPANPTEAAWPIPPMQHAPYPNYPSGHPPGLPPPQMPPPYSAAQKTSQKKAARPPAEASREPTAAPTQPEQGPPDATSTGAASVTKGGEKDDGPLESGKMAAV